MYVIRGQAQRSGPVSQHNKPTSQPRQNRQTFFLLPTTYNLEEIQNINNKEKLQRKLNSSERKAGVTIKTNGGITVCL